MSLWGPCLCPPSRVGERTKRSMPGPPFSLQANHTTVKCGATELFSYGIILFANESIESKLSDHFSHFKTCREISTWAIEKYKVGSLIIRVEEFPCKLIKLPWSFRSNCSFCQDIEDSPAAPIFLIKPKNHRF